MSGHLSRRASSVSVRRTFGGGRAVSVGSVAAFADWCLRGIGMAAFVSNPIAGLLLLAAVWLTSTWLGAVVSLGVVVSTSTALALRFGRVESRTGLYGYNGALAGAALGTFLAPEWSAAVLGYVALAGVLTTLLMAALMRWMVSMWDLRPLALPFNLVVMAMIVGLGQTEQGGATLRATPTSSGSDSLTDVVWSVIHGFGQLFFMPGHAAGLAVLAALVVCSRRIAALAVLGSATAVVTARLLGVDGYTTYLGVVGLNGLLTCVAVAGVFLVANATSTFLGVLGAIGSTGLLAALKPIVGAWGMPSPMSLAFCLVAITLIAIRAPAGLAEGRSTPG